MASSTAQDSDDGFLDGERMEQLRRGYYRFSKSKLSLVGLVMVLMVVSVALAAPFIAPYPDDRTQVNFELGAQAPSADHPMGTDIEGRDILTRVLFGARIALMVGTVILTLGIGIGVTLGLVAGYLGGRVNSLIMRVTDIFLSLPPIVLAMVVIAVTQPNLLNAIIAISFTWWAWYARLVQGEVLSVKEEEFVDASRAIGSSWYRTAFREVLPNVTSPIIVKATLDMGFAILVAAALSFIGIGVQPPRPSWGVMVSQGRTYIGSYWWISTFPGLAISFTVLGFNLLGDGLRDVFDVEVQ
jgi:peptide/nickel transport system permease protein